VRSGKGASNKSEVTLLWASAITTTGFSRANASASPCNRPRLFPFLSVPIHQAHNDLKMQSVCSCGTCNRMLNLKNAFYTFRGLFNHCSFLVPLFFLEEPKGRILF
jgi:hypothetical protein